MLYYDVASVAVRLKIVYITNHSWHQICGNQNLGLKNYLNKQLPLYFDGVGYENYIQKQNLNKLNQIKTFINQNIMFPSFIFILVLIYIVNKFFLIKF